MSKPDRWANKEKDPSADDSTETQEVGHASHQTRALSVLSIPVLFSIVPLSLRAVWITYLWCPR